MGGRLAGKLIIRDKTTNIVLGAVFFLSGSYFLWSAWEGRGQRTPAPVRPFVWF